MYTGIVQGAFPLRNIVTKKGLKTFTIELSPGLLKQLTIGASVAVEGVCLTVTAIDGVLVNFDVMQQTLNVTTLDQLLENSYVNVERSAKQGAEVGGHILSGHIDGTVEVVAITCPENNYFVRYRVNAAYMKYIFEKGFIALNGCSLTVAEVDYDKHEFMVCYIPETLRMTTHREKKIGDCVNFEIDRQTQVIVDTVENILASNPSMYTRKT